MFLKLLSVFMGGGIGSILRYLVSFLSKKLFLTPIIGTFTVNIIGCFFIGCISSLLINKTDIIPETLRLFIVVGFLGGLTTFSTLNIEVFELIRTGKIFYGLTYMILSCILGLLFTFAGYYLISRVFY